jgi:hypothetical protein
MDSESDQLLRLQIYVAKRLTDSADSSIPEDANPVLPGDSTLPVNSPRDEDLARSRETLIRKRISQTKHLMPLTAETLGPRFGQSFRQYAERNHVNGRNAIVRDALLFAEWLNRREVADSAAQDESVQMAFQLASWEATRHACKSRSLCIRFARFDWDFGSWSDRTKLPKKRRTCWCVLRVLGFRRMVRLY